MKQLKIGITAIALIAGIVSAFTAKAASRVGSFWTTTGGSTYLTTAAASAACPGTGVLCATQYTAGGHVTGRVILQAK